MIDYHCHLLPDIDDGAENIDESLAMSAALYKAGFKTIYCTPHAMKGYYDADNKQVLSALSNLRKRLSEENIKLEILSGREYYLDEFLGNYLKHPLPLGKTKYIMIEIPNFASHNLVKETCFRIKCGGFIPMIAHPERCGLFAMHYHQKKSFWGFTGAKSKSPTSEKKKLELIHYLKDIGCAFQCNIGSFIGIYGSEVQYTAKYFKQNELCTHFGTDAHSLHGVTILNRASLECNKPSSLLNT